MFSAHKVYVERLDKWLSKLYWKDCNLQSVKFSVDNHDCVVDEIAVFEPEPHNVENNCPTVRDSPKVQQAIEHFKGGFARPVVVGSSFGPSWRTKWFQLKLRFRNVCGPRQMDKFSRFLQWDSNSEALLYDSKGSPIQGFTGGDGADRREYFLLPKPEMHDNEDTIVYYYVEMACNGMFGNGNGGMIKAPDPNRMFTLSSVDVVYISNLVQELIYDMQILLDLSSVHAESHPTANAAISLAMRIMDTIDLSSDESIVQSHEMVSQFSHRRESCTEKGCIQHLQHEVYAVGHCHIDTAWLWPYRETRRKVIRSWCSQLQLMKTDPVRIQWKFLASQSVHWEWLREDEPELFEELLQMVRLGRFVPIGGSYVEFDANLPSGESMVRQFLYGGIFFQSVLQSRSSVFWLPDTFGYSGQLPQIMSGFGMKYFVSQKMSWNLTNKFPHNTFDWEGIDGTRVLCHFPPADTYNSAANVEEILKSCNNHKNKMQSNRSLLLFGHGDGGGGPSSAHLANLARLENCPGMPVLHLESSPEEFFQDIVEKDVLQSRQTLPVWVGELYLELHQGTLTSQGRLKKLNRVCEHRMRALEALLVHALHWEAVSLEDACSFHQQLTKLWKDILLNQFHDVLPGSCIEMVYNDAHLMLTRVLSAGESLSRRLMQLIDGRVFGNSGRLLFNPVSCDREEFVGNTLVKMGPFGFAEYPITSSAAANSLDNFEFVSCKKLAPNEFQLENSFVSVRISGSGQVLSLLDKRVSPCREVIDLSSSSHPFGNALLLYDDVPFYWDAWDIFPYHLHRGKCVNMQPVVAKTTLLIDGKEILLENSSIDFVSGFNRVTVSVTLTGWGNDPRTTLTQHISISSKSALIEFDTRVLWFESHKILKVEFPLSVRSTNAAFDIQYGLHYRPTHSNHSTDAARFEVCGHKFADISEPGYGVALLNDCKYGYSCRGGTICLSLLRAPKSPDENCDMGEHSFKYALLPHLATGVHLGSVVAAATIFNNPIVLLSDTGKIGSDDGDSLTGDKKGLFAIGAAHREVLAIDAVKLAEDLSGDVILRVVESVGSRGQATLMINALNNRAATVQICGMNEEIITTNDILPLRDIQQAHEEGYNQGFSFAFLPFKVITFRIRYVNK